MYRIEDKTLILGGNDRITYTINWDQFEYVIVNNKGYINHLRFSDVPLTDDKYVPNKIVVRTEHKYLFRKSGEIFGYSYDARGNSDTFILKQGFKYPKSIFNSIDIKTNLSIELRIYSNTKVNQLQGVINYHYLDDLLQHNYINKTEFSKYFNKLDFNLINYEIDKYLDEEFIVFNDTLRYIIVNKPSRFMLKKLGIIKLI